MTVSDVQRPWLEDPARIFTDAAAYADVDEWYAIAARLRHESPMLHVELPGRDPFWAVLRHAEVLEIEKDSARFTNNPSPMVAPVRPDPGGQDIPVKTLVTLDGDEHRARRGLIHAWFKPGSVRSMSDMVEALARRSVDEMAALGGACDFATDVANQFPLRVILSMLGLPESDFARMLQLTQELFGSDDPDFARIAEDDQMLAVIMDFFGYFSELTASRRADPGGDLASLIANAELDGEPLTDFDTFGYYLIIATAGHDTTSSAIAGGMWALLEHPDQLARLQQEPDLIDGAVDEILRYVTPVKHFMRTAQSDADIGGAQVRAGDWLMMSYPSANRDEAVFADPNVFDVARADAERHLGFGFGAHYCLGKHLAKLEIRSLFRELIPRLESIELAGDTEFVQSVLVSGPKHLPVRYRFR